MENILGINNNLVVKWRLLRNDGSPFTMTDYACKMSYVCGRGKTPVKAVAISGDDMNVLSWEFAGRDQHFTGAYTLVATIHRQGKQVAKVELHDAFKLVPRVLRKGCPCTQTLEFTSFVNEICDHDAQGTLSVLFPTFEITDDMHLHLHGDTENYATSFELGEDGHLIFKQ